MKNETHMPAVDKSPAADACFTAAFLGEVIFFFALLAFEGDAVGFNAPPCSSRLAAALLLLACACGFLVIAAVKRGSRAAGS